METILIIVLIIMASVFIISEVWRTNIAIKQEVRSEKIDVLIMSKLTKELAKMSHDSLERELKKHE